MGTGETTHLRKPVKRRLCGKLPQPQSHQRKIVPKYLRINYSNLPDLNHKQKFEPVLRGMSPQMRVPHPFRGFIVKWVGSRDLLSTASLHKVSHPPVRTRKSMTHPPYFAVSSHRSLTPLAPPCSRREPEFRRKSFQKTSRTHLLSKTIQRRYTQI
jgi:hypothetical protein